MATNTANNYAIVLPFITTYMLNDNTLRQHFVLLNSDDTILHINLLHSILTYLTEAPPFKKKKEGR